MPRILVYERGRTRLSIKQWVSLRDDPMFWELVRARALAVSAMRGEQIELIGEGVIGRIQLENFTIELAEKIPGALLSLLSIVYPQARLTDLPSPSTSLGPMFQHLLHTFISETHRYISRGRDWHYTSTRLSSPALAGKLSVADTVRLKARGRGHLLAFDKNELTHDTRANRVLYSALREVEKLKNLVSLDQSYVSSARSLQLHFSDCRIPQKTTSSSQLILEAECESKLTTNSVLASALALAVVVLGHTSFEFDKSYHDLTAPLSWFVNLENMFERAVMATFQAVLSGEGHVRHGSINSKRIFPELGLYGAQPDLIVESGQGVQVGDVKYKALAGRPSAADLYQLIVHAQTYSTDEAFLVYPGAEFERQDLGRSTCGVRVCVFTLDVRDLHDGVQRIVDERRR